MAGPRHFGTDGIRGRAGEGLLHPVAVERLGQATGHLLRTDPARFGARVESSRRIVVGRDTRPSGPELTQRLAAGLGRSGIEVCDLGVVTTPVLASLLRPLSATVGVMISASHNPAGDNGIKLFTADGRKIPETTELALEELLEGEPPVWTGPVAARVPLPEGRVLDLYLAHLTRNLPEGFHLGGFRVVLDCAQGGGHRIGPAVLRRLGADVLALHAEGRGEAINQGCGALHPGRCAETTRCASASLGLALDGDGDRAILADAQGTVRDGDDVLAVLGRDLADRDALPGRAVVGTVMSNLGLEEALRQVGVRLLRTPVGDRHVAELMLREGYVLGGEQSGHIICMGPNNATGDGLLTGLKVLEVIQRTGHPLTRLADVLQRFPQVLINVPVARRIPFDDLPEIRAAIQHAEEALEGKGRVLLRYSGTELLARVMVEGPPGAPVQEATEALARAVQEIIEQRS